jgi:magnesium chelatase family protein
VSPGDDTAAAPHGVADRRQGPITPGPVLALAGPGGDAMNTVVRTGGLRGIEGFPVSVEVDLSRGLPAFHLVGLPNTAVRESRERVLSSIRNSGRRLPQGRVTVNLAPADVRKEGAGHDLAIAVAVIVAERARRGRAAPGADRGLLVGELSLFGEIRPVRGLLAMALDARGRGEACMAVPACQAWEAALVPGLDVVPVATLEEAVGWFVHGRRPTHQVPDGRAGQAAAPPDLLSGLALARQPLAARAAMVAAAGRHHLLLTGPPGAGKTRLARLLAALLPDLEPAEALEVTRIHSAAGLLMGAGLVRRPPLRAPHHTTTAAGLLGGGASLRPGEVTLAHHGVLLLDELAEFPARVLDALREPLVDGEVRLVRGAGQRRFPARCQLVATTNPCRCGYLGSSARPCACGDGDLARHRARLSGPLRDRFDLAVDMGDGDAERLTGAPDGAPAEPGDDLPTLRRRIGRARELLVDAGDPPVHWDLARQVRAYGLRPAAVDILEAARRPLALTTRGVLRSCRVARTLAALDGRTPVEVGDIRGALLLRNETPAGLSAAGG